MGPLEGYRIVELAGIGPGPMCAMMLSDMGADVIRVDRVADSGLGMKRDPRYDLLNRGRRSVAVDMKTEAGRGAVLRLVGEADGLIEGFRPGVTERLGIGPDECLARNPRLVYGRMTGWGQEGPVAHAAGHDINYIALTGALHAVGSRGGPPIPRPEPCRGLRRGRDLPRVRDGVRTARGAALRPGAGRGCGHDGRLGIAHDHGLRHVRGRGVEGRTRQQRGRRWAATSTRCTRRRTASTCRSDRSRTSSTPSSSNGPEWIPPPFPNSSTVRSGPK